MKMSALVLLSAISLISGVAYAAPSQRLMDQQADASQALKRGIDKDSARDDSVLSQLAAARGDWTMSAALAAQSYKERPGIVNEFNLATAYQRTRQSPLSIPLYLDLVDRGRFTHTAPVQNFNGTWPRIMLPLVSDEAALRLKSMGVDVGLPATLTGFPAIAAR